MGKVSAYLILTVLTLFQWCEEIREGKGRGFSWPGRTRGGHFDLVRQLWWNF